MTDAIEVVGLRELRTELRRVDAAFPKELRKASLKVSELIAGGTRAAFSSMGGSAPKVAPTVKALAQQSRAQVKVGGGRGVGGDVAMGNLWGSKRYAQFPPRVADGYALYPTIKAKRDQVVNIYANALDDIVGRAFPK